MHTELTLNHWRKIAKLSGIGPISAITPHTFTAINICNDPQEYVLIHLETGKPESKKDKVSYVFDCFGLENVIVNGEKLIDDDYDIQLLHTHPEFIPIQKAFTKIMFEKHKKKFYHQSNFYREHLNLCAENEIKDIKNEIDKINDLNQPQIDLKIKEQKIMKLIEKLNLVYELKDLNFQLQNYLKELLSESQKKQQSTKGE